jgi:hypothetical protein
MGSFKGGASKTTSSSGWQTAHGTEFSELDQSDVQHPIAATLASLAAQLPLLLQWQQSRTSQETRLPLFKDSHSSAVTYPYQSSLLLHR